jgi:hypothetical protein
MSSGLLQKIAATTVGAAASVAVVGAIGWNQQAQAASFTYTSTIDATVSAFGVPSVSGSGVFTYLKQELATPGLYGYEVLDAAVTVGAQSYTLANFLADPAVQTQVSAFLNPVLGPLLPTPYLTLVSNVLAQDPNVFDYIGDGDFPPANFQNRLITFGPSNAYSALVSFNSTFVVNGSTTPTSEAVPEPTTMLGLGLAGAGLAAARRRRKQEA